MDTRQISLKILIRRFWKRTCLTWILVWVEGAALLLMPLVIGWAVDDILVQKSRGLLQLAGLCLGLLIIGAGRRFYDTRIYAGIYRTVSNEMVARELDRSTPVSRISARVNLFGEFIEFMEDAMPGIFNHLISLMGTLGILLMMDPLICGACVAGTVLVAVVYWASNKRILSLNAGANDEYERQVHLIQEGDRGRLKKHFKRLMGWNIRLSDLETLNFSLTWVVLAGVLLLATYLAAAPGAASFGNVVTLIMYVFGFIESIMTFPLYYQQLVRLGEISGRLG